MTPPVLLLGYNRPDLIEQQLDFVIKHAPRSSIYISIDGPKNTPTAKTAHAQIRQVVKLRQQKYPQRITAQFSHSNLGCQLGVESGLDWFFKHEECGIILEDDCAAVADFIPFCAQLLERFADDQRVAMISGTNPVLDSSATTSYFFSHQSIIWGWATWRRAWLNYKLTKQRGLEWLHDPETYQSLLAKTSARHVAVIEKVLNGDIDTWDYIWYLTTLVQGQYTIIPTQNLVSNVGFTANATHTKFKTTHANLPTTSLTWPLTHPTVVAVRPSFEKKYLREIQPWRVAMSVLHAYVGGQS